MIQKYTLVLFLQILELQWVYVFVYRADDQTDSYVFPGAYGERDGVGGGRDRERRTLPERRQRPAS